MTRSSLSIQFARSRLLELDSWAQERTPLRCWERQPPSSSSTYLTCPPDCYHSLYFTRKATGGSPLPSEPFECNLVSDNKREGYIAASPRVVVAIAQPAKSHSADGGSAGGHGFGDTAMLLGSQVIWPGSDTGCGCGTGPEHLVVIACRSSQDGPCASFCRLQGCRHPRSSRTIGGTGLKRFLSAANMTARWANIGSRANQ